MYKWHFFIFILCPLYFLSSDINCIEMRYTSEELVSMPGHLHRFGNGRPAYPVVEMKGFPSVRHFIENHVMKSKPLVMRDAAELSPGFHNWGTDDYFLSLSVPADNEVTVETVKKETRTQKTLQMNFKDFLRSYKQTEEYMVNSVPSFLLDDVSIPGPLQCKQIYTEMITDILMWFSSGGTKSVVHTDSVENINCLYRGEKEFVMVDPAKHIDNVDIDHPEGAYSDIDVDRADYTKYPGLADVEYYNVNMSAGDCLYIPFKWIHSVRSHNSNIAVNTWWNAHRTKDIDLSKCQAAFDPALTMSSVEVQGFDDVMDSVEAIREHITSTVRRYKKMDFEKLSSTLAGDLQRIEMLDVEQKHMVFPLMKKAFFVLDKNHNGMFELDEVYQVTDQEWNTLQGLVKNIDGTLSDFEEELDPALEEEYYPNAKYEL